MAMQSSIEWTDRTWNAVTGCDKISPGCKHCYAEGMTPRLQGMGNPSYFNGFKTTLHPRLLERPLEWKKPSMIFVNSMSDIFHKDVPFDFILQIFDTMRQGDWHTYQILTKRSDRLVELSPDLPWAANIWMGVSVENEDYTYRIDHLRRSAAHVKFLSVEPLLGPIPNLNLEGIDWVIVGGESGPKARPMDTAWVRDIRNQCQAANTPFFLKQLGGFPDKRGSEKALLDGRLWREMPLLADTTPQPAEESR